jgi:hypothetical protein
LSPKFLQCSKCKTTLIGGVFNRPDFTPCPSCAAPLQVEIFPAFFRPAAAPTVGEVVMLEGESSCFYHPQKKATVGCEGCGRFICALCDCVLNAQHFCPSCLEAGKTKKRIKSLEDKRTRYDNLALALAIYPILIFYFTLITAPATLFIVIAHWKTPLGLTQGSRAKLAIAGVLAVLQIIGWITMFILIFSR